jgi:hypothetical protein
MKRILFITLIFGLFSCEKDNGESLVNGSKPTKIIQISDYGHDTSFYTYDGVNPIMIESSSQRLTFEYESNRLQKLKNFRKGDDIPWLYLEYDYNTQNKVTKVSYYINVNSTVERWIGEKIDSYRLSAYYGYEYDGDMVIKEYYFDNQSVDTTSYNLIKFDSNKNIISKTDYKYMVDRYAISNVFSYEYDNKNHYLKNVNYPAYAKIFSIVSNIIKVKKVSYNLNWNIENGVTVVDSTTTILEYLNEYDDLDYPISISGGGYTTMIEYN